MGFHLIFNVYMPVAINNVNMAPPPKYTEQSPERTQIERNVLLLDSKDISIDQIDLDDGIVLAKNERSRSSVGSSSAKQFEVPSGLKNEVEFWKKIYGEYTSDQAVLHNLNDITKVYKVVSIPYCKEPPRKECLKSREDAIQREKDILLNELDPTGEKRTSNFIPTIRAQTGLRDKFEEAIKLSKKHLSKIEPIFEEYGIPIEITRLPFVESMFNTKAKSHAGAVGLWQLMPKTARHFGMKVGKKHDDRIDPVKSTRVAARHLVRDYNRLGRWDLAINAYNSGPGRIADAVNQLRTKDIVKIIRYYYHPAYSFAAKNFYPCFLAALNVYENRNIYFGGNKDVKVDNNVAAETETPSDAAAGTTYEDTDLAYDNLGDTK